MIKYLLFTLLVVQDLMAYSESPYKVVHQTDKYEIRFYEERLVVQTQYTNQNNGFRKLFNYISGNNKQSEKIAMTTPVNVTQIENEYVMQFYLPKKFTIDNAPKPSNKKVKLVTIEGGYYAILRYSGRTSDRNYAKKLKELQKNLEKDNIEMLDRGSKAIFDGPFTLPLLRRNEVMIKISWSE